MPPPPIRLVAAAALVDKDGRVLLTRRPDDAAHLPGLWEFPGGKIENGEIPEAAIGRELREELGIDTIAACLAPLGFASHDYGDFHLLLLLYICRKFDGSPRPAAGAEMAWVRPLNLRDFPMPPANDGLCALLMDLL